MHGSSPERKVKERNRACNETIGWRDCQNHKRCEINHSENSNHADETEVKKLNGANQESQKFHYRAVELKKKEMAEREVSWTLPGEKQKQDMEPKALAVFTLKMTGAFALGSKKISSIL